MRSIMSKEEKKNEMLINIDSLVKKGISFAKSLIKDNMLCEIDTLIDVFTQNGLKEREYNFAREKSDNSFSSILDFMFNHFNANPSNVKQTKEIIDTYVGEGNRFLSLNSIDPANDIMGVSELFWQYIIGSLNKYKTFNRNDKRDFLFTWIIGYKGCGKTTFINYFMSKKEYELNKEHKVISIRLNTAYIFDNDLELDQAIKFKICKILLNYYCKNSQKCQQERAFYSLDDLRPIYNERFVNTDRLDNFFDYFTGENTKRIPTKEVTEFSSDYQILLQYIRNTHKYTFLIILDNIDQLGVKPQSELNYWNRLKQIDKLMVENDLVLGPYLLVMRPATVYDISKLSRLVPKQFTIGIPRFSQIYKSRKEYLKLNGYFPFANKEEFEKYIDTYIQIIGTCLNNPREHTRLLPLEEALKNIEDFCTYNKRMAMNLVRLYGDNCLKDVQLTEYLSDIISAENQHKDLSELLQYGYYRFFEALMLHEGYCCRFNGYSYNKNNKKLTFSNRSEVSTDRSFLPNLFKFPSTVDSPKCHYSIFVNIRILQYLNRLNTANYLKISKIKKYLNDIFKYNVEVIELSCQVLIDACCIESSNDFANRFDEYSEPSIRITNRGKMVLSTFLEKVNYLSICFEDMPIPKEFIFIDDKFTFPMSNYYSTHTYENDINYFLLENVLYSSPIIMGMLKEIESYEKQKYENYINNTKKLKIEKIYEEEDFNLVQRLEKDARVTYGKIIDTYVLSKNAKEERFNYYFAALPYGEKR